MGSPARRARPTEHRESYRQLADDGRAFGAPLEAVVDERERAGVLYRLEHVRCGKRYCWCASEYPRRGHGPYWYAYWREDSGQRRSAYIGKRYMSVEAAAARKEQRRIAAEQRHREAQEARTRATRKLLRPPDLELAARWDGRTMSRDDAMRILGVRGDDPEAVRAAYRAMASAQHPDRARTERQRERATKIMAAANAARRRLLR